MRVVVIGAHYPILKKFGYGITKHEALTVALAGTKGAISLALALIAS